MKKSKIYTRGGDKGITSLIGGDRVKKCSLRLEAYGTIDELNSHIGLLGSMLQSLEIDIQVVTLQSRLFDIGTHLAMPCKEGGIAPCAISERHLEQLEDMIDVIDQQLPPLHAFVLPGGCMAASQCHVCRTVCRRAERHMIALSEEVDLAPLSLAFINRLSDFFFVLARLANKRSKTEEIFWKKDCT